MQLDADTVLAGEIRLTESLGEGRGWLAARGDSVLRVYPTEGDAAPPQASGPGLLPVEAAGEGWLAVPYRKTSLEDALRARGRLGVEEALGACVDILEALESLEAAGIEAPPLAPASIFLTEEGRAEVATHLLPPASGDPYRAPERRPGTPPSASTSVHAVGALLFHLLTGEVAERSPPPAPSGVAPEVPEWLDRVVQMAQDPDPGHRFPGLKAFRSALGAARSAIELRRREGGEVSTTRPPPPRADPGGPGFLAATGRWGLGGIHHRRGPAAMPSAEEFWQQTQGEDLPEGEAAPLQDRAGITGAPEPATPERSKGTRPVTYRFSWKRALTRGLPVLLVVGGILAAFAALVLHALGG